MFPELVVQKLRQSLTDVFCSRGRIIGSQRIVDKGMQARLLLRTQIMNRRIIARNVLHCQIRKITFGKTESKRRDAEREKSGGSSYSDRISHFEPLC